jgi:hypothetical protein
MNTGKRNSKMEQTYRSYDYILEKQIGRPSRKTAARLRTVRQMSIFLTGLVITLFVLSFTVFFEKDPVEASDGMELVKDYILIEVEEGDCLWTIADRYKTSDMSTESYLAEVEAVNGLEENTDLRPGNKLLVPVFQTVAK